MLTKLADGAWRGEAAYLVGGGLSLKDFDFSLLVGGVARIVAVNAAFKFVPWADVCLSEDERFFRRFAKELADFKGLKIFAAPDDSYVAGVRELVPDVVAIRSSPKREGWPKSLGQGLSTSSNSMIPALSLADIFGADPIYLLGVDCKPGSFHGLYPKDWEAGESQLESFKSDFEWWAAPHLKHRVVVNLNRDSAVTCWPKLDRDEFFRNVASPRGASLESGYEEPCG